MVSAVQLWLSCRARSRRGVASPTSSCRSDTTLTSAVQPRHLTRSCALRMVQPLSRTTISQARGNSCVIFSYECNFNSNSCLVGRLIPRQTLLSVLGENGPPVVAQDASAVATTAAIAASAAQAVGGQASRGRQSRVAAAAANAAAAAAAAEKTREREAALREEFEDPAQVCLEWGVSLDTCVQKRAAEDMCV